MKEEIIKLFNILPLESLEIDFICKVYDTDSKTVKPILKELYDEGLIKVNKSYQLKEVPQHIKDIPIKNE